MALTIRDALLNTFNQEELLIFGMGVLIMVEKHPEYEFMLGVHGANQITETKAIISEEIGAKGMRQAELFSEKLYKSIQEAETETRKQEMVDAYMRTYTNALKRATRRKRRIAGATTVFIIGLLGLAYLVFTKKK